MISRKLSFKKLPMSTVLTYPQPSLGTINGCGRVLLTGDNFTRCIDDVPVCEVYYHFFVLCGIPLIPLGCYDAKCISESSNKATYIVGTDQKMDRLELLYIYINGLKNIFWFIFIFMIIFVLALWISL